MPDVGGKGSDSTPGVQLRDLRASNLDECVETPCDPDARFRGRSWTGYIVHFTGYRGLVKSR